jgi:hypothetical protein
MAAIHPSERIYQLSKSGARENRASAKIPLKNTPMPYSSTSDWQGKMIK